MRALVRPIPVRGAISFCLLGSMVGALALAVSALGAWASGGAEIRTARAASGLRTAQAASGLRTAHAASGLRTARAARVVHLQEHGRLRLIAERGATLIERGTAHGTYTATMVVNLTIRSKSVSATVAIYPRGGSITASAIATYTIVRNLGYFGGTLTLGRGTGHYRHIVAVNHKPLGISGVINRYNFEVEVKANGEVSGV
jgi:hypothetical protein